MVFLDESGLLLSPLVRRTLSPQGETPILEVKAKQRDKVSLISALTLSPLGQHLGFYFSTLLNDFFESTAVVWFLRELLKHLRGQVIVIMDRGNMHRGREMDDLQKAFPRLHVEYLPAYAPDLNPVEQVWNYLKWNQLANYAATDTIDLEHRAFQILHGIRYDQQRLLSFWKSSDLPLPRVLAT